MNGTLHRGDCRIILPTLAADSVQCVVTSPPYLGLRDYGVDGQIGLEDVPDCLGWATGLECGHCFVCELVGVFRHVRRVLRPDGTCWVNLGDSYAGSGRGGQSGGGASTLDGGHGTQASAPRVRTDVSDHQRDHAAPTSPPSPRPWCSPASWRARGLATWCWTPSWAQAPRRWWQNAWDVAGSGAS